MKSHFFVLVLVVVFSTLSCNSGDDDSSSNDVNACNLEPFPGVANVTHSGFMVTTFDTPTERGYFISTTITNANDFAVSGQPSFVFRENGEITNYSTSNSASAFSCLDIDANASCAFEMNIYLLQDETIDGSIDLLCFYYFDE